MEFKEFADRLRDHIRRMEAEITHLFTTDVPADALWETYLASFPAGSNDVFRTRRVHDCSACRQFIKHFGGVVSIVNGRLTTIWDLELEDDVYHHVASAMANLVRSHSVSGVLVPESLTYGIEESREMKDGNIITWSHLSVTLSKQFGSIRKPREKRNETIGRLRDSRNVFMRSLDEISTESIETVLELIAQRTLYRGNEWEAALRQLLTEKSDYEGLDESARQLFAWERSVKLGDAISRIRNHSIGVLLIDLTNEIPLDDALRTYERIVAPTNYKRPTAVFTEKMVQQAKKTLEELGLLDALERRYALTHDISAANTLFVNRSVARSLKGDVFKELGSSVRTPRKLSREEDIDIATFLSDVLPSTNSIELLFEPRLAANLVSLIAPGNADSTSLFKWGNSFSWAYRGNIADSMKELVTKHGGDVNGVLRFSIMWNDMEKDLNDLDAHCIEPDSHHIFYRNARTRSKCGGVLDVDIIHPVDGTPAVENITWNNTSKMKEGPYVFFVENFNNRGGKGGFSAEIEFADQLYEFHYPRALKHKERVDVATVTYSKENGFSIKKMPYVLQRRRDVWNLATGQLHPVSIMMYSPNYWDGNRGVGHQHLFLMLEGCINSENPNGFFNEYLREDLLQHKRVFEALGGKMHVAPSEHQLSGVGFSLTKKNTFTVKVEGHTTRTLRVHI
jgi:hypothetical protein